MINLFEVLKNFPSLSKQLHCRGLLFTQYECPQTTPKEKFFIECSFITYVISGRRIFHKNGKTWDLTEGTCAFVKKGAHISERPEEEGWCVMVFFLPDDFLAQLIIEHRKNLHLANLPPPSGDHVLLLQINEFSKSFFFSMLPYFSQSPPPAENLVELKFKELILSLLSNPDNNSFLSYLNSLSNDRHIPLEEVMQNNFMFNLSMADYAKLACKSISTFKREFKKRFNDSPARWILTKRLDLATELLQTTQLGIAEITLECGFENQTHFSRVFKEKTGLSPLKFRSQLQSVTPTSHL